MPKLVSVYNRSFRSLNSSGPDDPTASVFIVGDTEPFPQKLMDANAVRFIAFEYGGIIYASETVRQSIAAPYPMHGLIKMAVLSSILKCCRQATVKELEDDLK